MTNQKIEQQEGNTSPAAGKEADLQTWGSASTQFFYELTPGVILDAIERSTGRRCSGRALALNSMENRVYEIEWDEDSLPAPAKTPADRFCIAKFYRPGRWSKEQILEEHQFLLDLVEADIPVVAPMQLSGGQTLHQDEGSGLYYAIFPKVGGRSPDELSTEELARVGRYLGRMHRVGMTRKAEHRVQIAPQTYGLASLSFLTTHNHVPQHIRDPYESVVKHICERATPHFEKTAQHRVHGDCHLGNLLFGRQGYFWVDFDDMVTGPAVQDLWLMLPGRYADERSLWDALLRGYETMHEFDDASLKLVEPLRALRMVHFSAWIAKRWEDPAFKRAFGTFGSDRYWQEQLNALGEQKSLIQHL
jgi:Ser/Thr protein kinase RdoA (MazF antagonist)